MVRTNFEEEWYIAQTICPIPKKENYNSQFMTHNLRLMPYDLRPAGYNYTFGGYNYTFSGYKYTHLYPFIPENKTHKISPQRISIT
jgi:hypothetical protein